MHRHGLLMFVIGLLGAGCASGTSAGTAGRNTLNGGRRELQGSIQATELVDRLCRAHAHRIYEPQITVDRARLRMYHHIERVMRAMLSGADENSGDPAEHEAAARGMAMLQRLQQARQQTRNELLAYSVRRRRAARTCTEKLDTKQLLCLTKLSDRALVNARQRSTCVADRRYRAVFSGFGGRQIEEGQGPAEPAPGAVRPDERALSLEGIVPQIEPGESSAGGAPESESDGERDVDEPGQANPPATGLPPALRGGKRPGA